MSDGTTPTPDREALLALAARCEKAEVPDRELDYAIHECLHGEWLQRNAYIREPGDDGWYSVTPPVKGANFIAAPQSYTASLDAAMTLVPDGWRGRIFIGNQSLGVADVGGPHGAFFTPADSWEPERSRSELCWSPALALTAAALKARALAEDRP